jgi:hypothetical protein
MKKSPSYLTTPFHIPSSHNYTYLAAHATPPLNNFFTAKRREEFIV